MLCSPYTIPSFFVNVDSRPARCGVSIRGSLLAAHGSSE